VLRLLVVVLLSAANGLSQSKFLEFSGHGKKSGLAWFSARPEGLV
jgi:hypothetical protein